MKAVKLLIKLPLKGLLGAAALVIVNLIGGLFNFHLALNPGSAFTSGILGIPGLVLLTFLKYLFYNI